eukprot:11418032-Alexandrium_andersonii.AAC.1
MAITGSRSRSPGRGDLLQPPEVEGEPACWPLVRAFPRCGHCELATGGYSGREPADACEALE